MKKILLACSSGMSTSLLVTKMQEYAKSIGDEAEIWAVGQDQAAEDMAKADAVLIGPQMSFSERTTGKGSSSIWYSCRSDRHDGLRNG